MKKNTLPKAPIKRMFRQAGGNRLSDAAQDMILENVEDYAMNLMKGCIDISKHVGRKTVTVDDVKLAKKLDL